MKQSWTRALVLALLAATFVGYALLLWQGPWWLDGDRLRRRDLQPADGVVITGFRTTLVALGAGAVAGAGLFYTDRTLRHTRDRDREQAQIARDGQVTAHYVEAIKLLASERTVERLGGIYALERIMRDSAKDHLTVVEVLAAFVRDQVPVAPGTELAPAELMDESVQAALTVLGRRPPLEELFRIDLRRTDLRGADLQGARLERVRLAGARLEGANLIDAHLEKAWLRETQLSGVWLDRAHLEGAYLRGADLRGASLKETHLKGTRLFNADLSTAVGLTPDQAGEAMLDVETKLPPAVESTLRATP
ncbi:pentapeptide repeat-containing protein [Streptomyces sp. 43Y-GA-1]|uniref:pentapeptide repeat-containing protein n=1 Tax=Streptomyces sp. 43Y-GA-1 TaxID=2939435 RepID=UPI0020C06594|nr:pentapeptide repeat-containing protein [Streptomyces sp. 43Y-GA-1]MCL6293174.1 pentapeptide repeat-containing protein [Streptomyces sp. 43Y-GA-1]